jgi:cell wall-associated NlpC family hydrolase
MLRNVSAGMSGSAVDIKPFGRAGLGRAARAAGAIAVTVVCLLAAPVPAQAASVGPSDGQLSAAQQAANSAGQQVGRINAQIALAQGDVSRARAAANIALGRYESRQAAYVSAEAEAQRAADAADAARAAQDDARAQVAAFARSSYIQGSTSAGYAAALTADGPGQMMERNALLAAANGHRTDVLGRMTVAADRASAATRAAATARDAAASVRQQAQIDLSAASNLETLARRKAGALQKQQVVLQARLQTAQQNLLGLRRAKALATAYQRQQAAAAAVAASYSTHGSTAISAVGNRGRSPAVRTAIAAALSYVGQMYAWGGGSFTGPTEGFGPDVGVVGFDCSGLTRYAYAQAGITIPRVAADQYAALPSVSSLQPGDLVFYATDPRDPATVHHVAMYLGRGQMIEAPESGERVHVTAMRYGYEYIGAVRPTA